jgi:hypothetical protein
VVTILAVTSVAIWVYLIAFRGGFWRFWHPPVASRESPPRAVVAVVPARDEAEVIERSIALAAYATAARNLACRAG